MAILHFRGICFEVMGKISIPGLKLAHQAYSKRFADGGVNHVIYRGLLISTVCHSYQHVMRTRQEPLSIDDFDQN